MAWQPPVRKNDAESNAVEEEWPVGWLSLSGSQRCTISCLQRVSRLIPRSLAVSLGAAVLLIPRSLAVSLVPAVLLIPQGAVARWPASSWAPPGALSFLVVGPARPFRTPDRPRNQAGKARTHTTG